MGANLPIELVPMSRPAPPALTVRTDGSQRTFAPGHDVVIGRDLRADVRVAHPLVSRAHVVLRFDRGRWVAIDNGSLNGIFVDHRRVPSVEIRDGQTIHIGNPDGPRMTFEVGRHTGSVGRPPQTTAVPVPQRASASFQAPQQSISSRSLYPPSTSQPDYQAPQQIGPSPGRGGSETSNIATSMMRILRGGGGAAARAPGSVTIGRATDNDIVIPDVLASRHHATLVPTPNGLEIQDNRSINGTFVNGTRVDQALLHEGDVITIGNVDLVFSGGTLVRRTETEAATRTGGLEVHGVSLTVEHDRKLLDNISFAARPGTLTAVIGPSGAGKSTLARVIVGATRATRGKVLFEGHDIHAEYASLRSRIGMVPQDDVVHRQLTVEQALGYAAELRLPPDTTKEDRRQVIAQVLDELELTPHAQKRVDKLSGGQRKRASVAMELLTGPSLLILDEPTSGLDPALDRQVMTMLRRLADAGRVVIVVTHSLTYVSMCDQLLLLAPGGKTAFADPPSQIGAAMGSTDWADIFARVSTDPDGVHRAFRARHPAAPRRPSPTAGAAPLGKPPRTSRWRQVGTLARRQARLMTADRGYFAFLALLPFVLGVLSLAVPGSTGLGNANSTAPEEPIDILILLNIGAVFMGTALTVRDLVGERMIFQRERAVGLSASAYLMAKVLVFSAAALIETAVMVVIMTIGKGAPSHGGVLLGHSVAAGVVELWLTLALT